QTSCCASTTSRMKARCSSWLCSRGRKSRLSKEAVKTAATASASRAAARRITRLEPCGSAEMALVRAGLDDLHDLRHDMLELVVGREVVRAQAETGLRPEVAQNLAGGELP